MAASLPVKEVDSADFQTDVIEESRRRPVVVDFWAEWCGPCRILGPILEKLADECQGGFLLAKVDTESNPEIAEQYRIQSIPNVKVFRDGELVDEFIGALPEDQVRAFLRRNCPSAADRKADQAALQIRKGDIEAGRALLREALALDPRHSTALFELGRLDAIDGDAQSALTYWNRVPASSPEWDRVQVLKNLLELQAECASGKNPEEWSALAAADPGNLEAHFAHGCCLTVSGDYRGALDEFLHVVSRNRNYRDEAARKAMLTIFSVLGERSEISEEYRKRLAQTIF